MRYFLAVIGLTGCVNFTQVQQHCPSENPALCVGRTNIDGVDNTTDGTGENTGPTGATGNTQMTCTPRTCAEVGALFCGTADDNCGTTLICACTSPLLCGARTASTCGAPPSLTTAVVASPAATVPQGLGAAPRNVAVRVNVTGTGLGAVSAAMLSDGSAGAIDSASRTETTLAIDFMIPHGATPGAKSLLLSHPTGVLSQSSVITVTPIKVTPAAAAAPGSDSAIGSTLAPFATINHALSVAASGDTILLAPAAIANHTVGLGAALSSSACGATGTANVPAGVTIRGDGALASLISPGGNVAAFITSGAATINLIAVEQFTIGVLALGGPLQSDELFVGESTACAVSLQGNGDASFSRLVMQANTGDGLHANKTGGTVTLNDIVADGNTGDGIALYGTMNGSFTKTSVTLNSGIGLSASIIGNLTVTGLVADDNGSGLWLTGSTNATIDMPLPGAAAPFAKGTISRNGYNGVFAAGSAALQLRGATGGTGAATKSPIRGKRNTGSPNYACLELDDAASVVLRDLDVEECSSVAMRIGINNNLPFGKMTSVQMYSSFVQNNGEIASPGIGILNRSTSAVYLDNVVIQDQTIGILIEGDGNSTVGPVTIANGSRIVLNDDLCSFETECVGILLQGTIGSRTLINVNTGAQISENPNGGVFMRSPGQLTLRNATMAVASAASTFSHIRIDTSTDIRVDLGTGGENGNNSFVCSDGYILRDARPTTTTIASTISASTYSASSCPGGCNSNTFGGGGFCFAADQVPLILYEGTNDPGAGACSTRGLLSF
ncbi:MAG: right-handed parallel beta-helix repeat-containing protein [Deltaproteobacteria bacterium]|nr:right-handed parallel beta-helix repeat-containing protein [Deltaproteobacteria bacterium]